MKKTLLIFVLIGLFADAYSAEKPNTSKNRLPVIDTTQNPCHQFKQLKTAQQYFESANNRTKGCWPNDSLTTVIAAKEYSLAVKLNPKYWQARRNYARQLIVLKQYDLAIAQLNEAIKLTGGKQDFYLYAMRGEAFYEKGQYEKAIADYDVAMKYSGNIDYLLLIKAKAQWKLGQKEEACTNYKKSVEMTPHLAEKKEFILCD
ncbi:MAG: hypothetical protein V4538_00345 [Bacteroidota bacterium]